MHKLFQNLIIVTILTISSVCAHASCSPQECLQEAAQMVAEARAISATLVPRGAVMAFNLKECPPQWTEYQPARGRFIRGIDTTSETSRDPDGKREPGSIQEDQIKNHFHKWPHRVFSGEQWAGAGKNSQSVARRNIEASATNTDGGGVETRPKNVALLYCEKD